MRRNFWGYVKDAFNRKDSALPSFSKDICTSYFSNTLSALYPNRPFSIPSWIPKLAPPHVPFNLDPPTYHQATNAIRKMKASGSPCPLDQISVICFKRCPYLRSYLTEIIRSVWLSGTIPSRWKKHVPFLSTKKVKQTILLTFARLLWNLCH